MSRTIAQHNAPRSAISRSSTAFTLPAIAAPLLRALTVWAERRRLARLDAHLLGDLGLSNAQAASEARRPIWDLPR